MWSKRQSQLLLLRVSRGGLRRLVIPVPLFVLDLTLAAFSDLACLLDSFAPKWMRGIRQFDLGGSGVGRISAESMLTVCLRLFQEMRKYGRFRLVEVQTGRIRVYIDLY
jgi:hypothetical protein